MLTVCIRLLGSDLPNGILNLNYRNNISGSTGGGLLDREGGFIY